VGSGTGAMVRAFLEGSGADYIVALEPLPSFLSILRRLLGGPRVDAVQGYIEYMPFRNGAFDIVVAGFMLRDVSDLGRSVAMMARGCRGEVVILDFWRPSSVLALVVEVVYMFLIMGLVAAAAPREVPSYMKMIATIFSVPPLRDLIRILRSVGEVELRCWALCIVFLARIRVKRSSKG